MPLHLTSMGDSDAPIAVVRSHHPGTGTFVSRLKDDTPFGDNLALLAPGTVLRNGYRLGIVLKDRKVDGLPIYGGSVAVRCICSLHRFASLDLGETNVWPVCTSQVLEGKLLQAAEADSKGFLERFAAVERRYKEQERAKRQSCPPKKPNRVPGKRR